MTLTYQRPSTPRKCYWKCLGRCLKVLQQCSPRCPGYLSVAQAKRLKEERRESYAYQMERSEGIGGDGHA
jgi:hypothetical protein